MSAVRKEIVPAWLVAVGLVVWAAATLSRAGLLWYALRVFAATYPGVSSPSFWVCFVALDVVRTLIAMPTPAGRSLSDLESTSYWLGWHGATVIGCAISAGWVWSVSP